MAFSLVRRFLHTIAILSGRATNAQRETQVCEKKELAEVAA